MAPNPAWNQDDGSYLQSGSSSLIRTTVIKWLTTQQPQSSFHQSPYLSKYTCLDDMDSIREQFKRASNYTDDEIEEFRQRQLKEQNMLAWGASVRGGYMTTKDEAIAKMLQEEEQQKEREKERENKWFEILDHSNGNSYVIEIIRDRCSSANFVTARAVTDYSLETKRIDPMSFIDVAGGEFTCDAQAEIHWKGKGGEMRVDFFYVLPDKSPIKHTLVGKEFDDAFGRFLLDSNPDNKVFYTAQKPKTPTEDKLIREMRRTMDEQVARSSQNKLEYEQNRSTKAAGSSRLPVRHLRSLRGPSPQNEQ